VQTSLPDPTNDPLNRTKRKPKFRQFLTMTAQANFHRLLDSCTEREAPKQGRFYPQRHTTAKSSQAFELQDVPLKEVPLNKKQWKSLDEVFGSPKYFAFVAQAGIPHDLLTLAAEARVAYHAGKPKEQGNSSKVTKLPRTLKLPALYVPEVKQRLLKHHSSSSGASS
jgi:hypothetical protein